MRTVLILALLCASVAGAAPYEVAWVNRSDDRAARGLLACWGDADCAYAEVACGPGEVCRTELDLPAGERAMWLRASPDLAEWSGASSTRVVAVPAPEPPQDGACSVDLDGDGLVSVSDFAALLRSPDWTVARFATLLWWLGSECER